MLIVYPKPQGIGWHPVTCMARLAAELFDAELLELEAEPNRGRFNKLRALFNRRERSRGNETVLVICPSPSELMTLTRLEGWQSRFKNAFAWIIDSFWTDRIPRVAKWNRIYDHLFITSAEDADTWKSQMRTPVTWLPWGADVLRLGGMDAERRWDLTRMGRQPPEWEDDSRSRELCRSKSLTFQGRVEGSDDAAQNQRILMELYRQTKFLLAFSNGANPTSYTHPTREYLTARWTDGLACGAIITGIAPKEASIANLLWEGATLDFDSTEIEEGLSRLAEGVSSWTPERARINYRESLRRLDWRWRFKELAECSGESFPRLNHELELLARKIRSVESGEG